MADFAGHLFLVAAAGDQGRTTLAAQSFRAPFHLSKPYWDAPTRSLLVQVVNPTAGILAGDRLESEISVQRNAALIVTTPGASRVFQMRGGAAASAQQFTVAAGAWLEVVPEPLVPHRGSRFQQTTVVDVERDGALFYVDQFTPGRVAHGETWAWDRLCLELTVRVGGELALRERLDQSGEDLRNLAELAGSGATACFANAVLVAPVAAGRDDSSWRSRLSALHGEGLWLGVSALRLGGWSIKLVARDTLHLRPALREMRRILAESFPKLGCDLRKL